MDATTEADTPATTETSADPEPGWPTWAYLVAALVLVLGGLAAGSPVDRLSPPFTVRAVEGVSVFALLYVLTQAVERVVEFVILGCTLSEKFAEHRKQRSMATVRTRRALLAADSTSNGNPSLAGIRPTTPAERAELVDGLETAKDDVAAARKELLLLSQGLAFALAYLTVRYADVGFLGLVGVTRSDSADLGWIDAVVTALVVAGGSKGLHDLLSKIQKTKENAEEK